MPSKHDQVCFFFNNNDHIETEKHMIEPGKKSKGKYVCIWICT